VLVVGLIFLAMLSLMGIAAYSSATQEERMAGNTRDRLRAFEAAETSLRDCEAPLGGIGGLPAFNGTGGMYAAPPVTALPMWETVDWKDATAVRVLGTSIADVALPPRCIVEEMLVLNGRPPDGAISMGQQLVPQTVYRVTAMGFGMSTSTSTITQSTFRRQ
jgi:type IV pilus assembly protein PilX